MDGWIQIITSIDTEEKVKRGKEGSTWKGKSFFSEMRVLHGGRG